VIRRVGARLEEERGQALLFVIFIVALMTVIAGTLVDVVVGAQKNAGQSVTVQTSYQAAEAGIDEYTSKLVEDHLYYTHYVAAGESTREASNGTLVTAGNAWSYDLNWTYPNGKDTWASLPNGYQYNLEITAPSAATKDAITILATGRPTADTNMNDWTSVQTLVRPASLADFYRFVNGNVSFGSTTTTNGQIYANGTVNHAGTATANIYAYGGFSGNVTLQNGAQVYSGSTAVKSQIPDAPINFNNFLASLTTIQAAMATNGLPSLNNASVAAWQLVFNSNGTFTYQSCQQTSGQDVSAKTPTCGPATTETVPSNGAIYSPQTIIVSGQVHGRVTVASNNNIVIGGNISYVTPGQDVLGLIAENNVIVPQWAPTNLTWTGAVLAETGTWESYSSDGSHGTMTFTGSSATDQGGDFTMFQTRVYNYDPNLLFLSPPWFPTLADSYTTLLFRQVPVTP
jgi:Tfp pilus assembly protein PilX